MTVSTTTSTAQFDPNGVTINFPFAFRFFAATDLKVFWQKPDGTIQLLVLNSNYTVQGAGNDAGGSITTIGTPLPDGLLVVSRIMVATQLTSFRNQGEFFAEIHEDAFDKLVMLVQQTIDNQGRELTVPVADPLNINLVLPGAVVRAGKALGFDVNGQPIVSTLTLEQIEQQPALALDAAAQAETSAFAAGNSKDAAALSATASSNSAVLSQKWAENPEDTPVTPELFSARHWANKAAALVDTISGLYTRMTAVEEKATALEDRPRALGDGQDWINVTDSRGGSTWYPNDTGRSIVVQIIWTQSGGLSGALYVRNPSGTEFQLDMCQQTSVAGGGAMTGIVPPGWDYRVVMGNTVTKWHELR
ncbi:MAG: hypothetical protein Q7T99_15215 [Pseudomonas sp.]|nr:hypothetical protein [Pseudomonas sp.]